MVGGPACAAAIWWRSSGWPDSWWLTE
ncbi:hypothetical protein A2U01_0110027, partial [Trifolium medium]|nr:hypothetical protein [Trifolium medium]